VSLYTDERAAVALDLLKSRGETAEHFALKLHAARKLRARGYRIVAFEVSAYLGLEIADVVGVDLKGKRIAVVEAKQDRADFAKDARPKQQAMEMHEAAVERYDARLAEYHALPWQTQRKKRRPRSPVAPSRKMRHPSVLAGISEAWIITSPGLVIKQEIPEGWGWMTPERIQVKAPERQAEPKWFRYAATHVFYRLANVYQFGLLGMDSSRTPPYTATLLDYLEDLD